MFDKQEREDYLRMIESNMAALQARIDGLNARIHLMRIEGYETKPQVQLLANMVSVMQSINAIRLETLEVLKIADDRVRPRPDA